MKKEEKYKTELCNKYPNCKLEKCLFAHSKVDLIPKLNNPKHKTALCKNYHELGTCNYGSRCSYIHNKSNTKRLDVFKKIHLGIKEEYINQEFSYFYRTPFFESLNKDLLIN